MLAGKGMTCAAQGPAMPWTRIWEQPSEVLCSSERCAVQHPLYVSVNRAIFQQLRRMVSAPSPRCKVRCERCRQSRELACPSLEGNAFLTNPATCIATQQTTRAWSVQR